MNVTVFISKRLRAAVEGRGQVQLGLPSTAGVGEAIETLFALYPRLADRIADERDGRGGLNLALGERGNAELARGLPGLREGARLYVFSGARSGARPRARSRED